MPADPALSWSALAPLLAGQPRVRLSRDGGRSYPQKYERDLTQGLPSVPAAVRIFGKDGCCRAIFLDFDSSIGGTELVESDTAAVKTWLGRTGARWIEDYSPNGGRHLYVPLAVPVAFTDARDLVEALANRARSLDKTPHQNLLHGCMRTPGSPHKRGGHQQLAMSLAKAYDVARRPNPAAIWQAMTADISEEIAAVRTHRRQQTFAPDMNAPTASPVGGRMSRAMQQLALTGLYDANRYTSDSDARQAVITAAAAAGMTLSDVDRRIKQGIWPGLASFYARYPGRHRAASLKRDWMKALDYLKKNRQTSPVSSNAHKSPTSQPNTQAQELHRDNFAGVLKNSDAEHRFIRTWRNSLRLSERRYTESRNGMARRMVLRALGEAAHMSGSRFVEFGDRSLAVATGLDHTTVGAHLRALRREGDPLITLVEQGRGTKGDLYMLTVPVSVRTAAEEQSWRRGKVHALRPAFRVLGLPAAFVYEALEHGHGGLSVAELVRSSKLSRTAVEEALDVLAAWNLVARGEDRAWSIVASTSLRLLAEQFGVVEEISIQLRRYKVERERWRHWLATHTVHELLIPHPDEDYPWDSFEGPPDDWTLVDLAFSRLGRVPPLVSQGALRGDH
ncbi:MarR family transcriptional regulator [Paenarthrobacter sp. DKR-5]|uniref:MarR family transcriptional regulator n=1 Tax=Paenarthrobacter sp. DKR-5 TaxID=2835535 RepID=UPI001BDD2C4C|nr:MarR family transcriptional regulator [Paenarthrobacter sp. DKR-5]MBT1003980.1 MarR family transcriptional regulator [Paenarthrobacter sp. DKR-5]